MKPDEYDRKAQSWADGKGDGVWSTYSKDMLEDFRIWLDHASLEELESWFGNPSVQTVLKTLKPHHQDVVKREWGKQVEFLRGEA